MAAAFLLQSGHSGIQLMNNNPNIYSYAYNLGVMNVPVLPQSSMSITNSWNNIPRTNIYLDRNSPRGFGRTYETLNYVLYQMRRGQSVNSGFNVNASGPWNIGARSASNHQYRTHSTDKWPNQTESNALSSDCEFSFDFSYYRQPRERSPY